jgi:hypothetical protein
VKKKQDKQLGKPDKEFRQTRQAVQTNKARNVDKTEKQFKHTTQAV